jgi:HlyD family secretion protein/macrolide-specific efflux system membrane fusion protein
MNAPQPEQPPRHEPGGAASLRSPIRKRRRWPWILLGTALLGAVTIKIGVGRSAPKDLDGSLIVPVKKGDLPIEVIETGKVQPREKVEVKSKVAGQVEKVFVEEGALVKKGQPLLRLDATDFRRDVARTEADVGRAQADVAQAQNALEFAKLSFDRKQKGLEGRGVAQIDVDFAANEVKAKTVALQTAEVVLSGAKVALGAAQDRLRYTQIMAPMEGTVIQRGIEEGEVVTPGVQATFEGKALLTIADLSTLIVKADLNQIDVAKVKLGQKVKLTLDALPGKTYEATITKVAPASSTPKGGSVEVFPVEATLTTADGNIKPGMTADVRVHIETKPNVLYLPIEAVVKEAGKAHVTRVITVENGQQKTEKAEVKTGLRNDRDVEVLDGVKPGDKVLIKPASAAENEVK